MINSFSLNGMINTEKLEKKLEHLLQREVRFEVNGKVLRRGKLQIYQVKDFYINFTIINDRGDIKKYDVPYPFAINITEDSAFLSYTLEHLACGNKMLHHRLKCVNKIKKNKLYNSILKIIPDI